MRQNILDWATSKVQSATTSVVLTHNIDFLFIESILLSRLRQVGHPKLTIFADAGCAAATYDQQHRLITGLGTRYRVVPIDLGPGRRFHPKAFFLAGKNNAALAIGSGNLTHGGWSANREIWSEFDTDDEPGLAPIAAFRTYLQQVLGLSPIPDITEEQVLSAFSPQENVWATNLPEPGGLLGSPAAEPLLERILRNVQGRIDSILVCTPYFDPTAEALKQIASRVSASVETLLQPGKVGLAKSAAAALPQTVALKSISEREASRFIHAKIFAFRGPRSSLLVVGSANCSKAALLAEQNWGNAELVSVRNVENPVVDELFADFEIRTDPPELPAEPPQEDWNPGSNPLRVLAARYSDGVITIRYKIDGHPIALCLLSEKAEVPISIEQGPFIQLPLRQAPTLIRLKAVFPDESEVVSQPCWVDNEEALSTTAYVERIRGKLAGLASKPKWSTSDYVELLELFDQHLRHPSPGSRITNRQDIAETDRARYSIEDVFSDTFGAPPPVSSPGVKSQFDTADFLRLFESFYSPDNKTRETVPSASGSTEDETGEDPNAEAETEKLREKSGQSNGKEEPAQRKNLYPKLRKTLEQIEKSFADIDFFTHRPPARIAADIGLLALVLAKSLIDGVLPRDEFRTLTQRFWSVLFFGSQGVSGAIPRRLDQISTADPSFVQSLTSPRLSAALLLWCLPEWQAHDSAAAWFRLSAGVLAVQFPWLSQGGTPEEITTELSRISRTLRRESDPNQIVAAWRKWVRSGRALQTMEEIFQAFDQKRLADLVGRAVVKKGELLWQGGCFCTAEKQYTRDQKTKAEVHPLGSMETRRFIGSWLTPVSDLLMSTEIAIPAPVRRELLSLVEDVNPSAGR